MNADLRALLHRALEDDLAPGEREALTLALQDASVRAEFERLGRLQALLRTLPIEPAPGFLARDTAREIALRAALAGSAPALPGSVAGQLSRRIAQDADESAHPAVVAALRRLPRAALPASIASVTAARIHRAARHNPAPLALVGGLVAAFVALTASFAWPNLAAGATVLRELLGQLSPLVFVGFALLLASSALVSWRPTAGVQRGASLAFVLAFVLALPSITGLFAGRAGQDLVRLGGDVVVTGAVAGNVIAIGGDVVLREGARVNGEAVAFLGDVRRAEGARVQGRASALLGEVTGAGAPGGHNLSTRPLPALGTASAFQPILAWLSGAAWPRIYVAALGAITLLLFLGGVAPQLARSQRHAPLRTLALGTLVFSLGAPPLVFGALSGFLVPAFVGAVLLLLALSVGLAVTLHDGGRILLRRLRVPQADALGALVGLSAFAASLSLPPLAFALWLLGGCWGAGTLLLARPSLRTR